MNEIKVEYGEATPTAEHVKDVETIFAGLSDAADEFGLTDTYRNLLRDLREKLTVKPVVPPQRFSFYFRENDSYQGFYLKVEAESVEEAVSKVKAALTAVDGLEVDN